MFSVTDTKVHFFGNGLYGFVNFKQTPFEIQAGIFQIASALASASSNFQSSMIQNISRKIKPEAERVLWAKAAGRCQFNSCNKLLYKSGITEETVNLAEKAHIYSFAEDGPRGQGPFKSDKAGLNDVPNLLLVCGSCHVTIDQDKAGSRYSAALLKSWKDSHELRVRTVTGIDPSKKSNVVIYGARIGNEGSPLQFDSASQAMFPNWFPAQDRAVNLSMTCSHDDGLPEFWTTEAAHLKREFERNVRHLMEDANSLPFSVFALAPQPLLILLGTLFTDKAPVEVYQLHREPRGWEWQAHSGDAEFFITEPVEKNGIPVLVFSISGKIDSSRVSNVLSGPVSIWEISVKEPHNDFMRSQVQLAMFRQLARKLMVKIQAAHPNSRTLYIFPAMPVSCAVELGRIRMPKADIEWAIFDQSNKHGKFISTLTIATPL